MRVDDSLEYHCVSNLQVGENFLKMNASQRQIYLHCRDRGVKDMQARPLAHAVNKLLKRVNEKNQKKFTQDDVALMLKDAIAAQANHQNLNRTHLFEQLALVENELRPVHHEIENLKEVANTSAQRYGFSFFAILALQFSLSQYGTYIAFSWDIMEPLMACVTLSDGIAAYLFWIWAGKPWDVEGLKSHFFERRLKKLLKKNNISYEKYKLLEQTKQEIMSRLANH